jgi:hypothetical protein
MRFGGVKAAGYGRVAGRAELEEFRSCAGSRSAARKDAATDLELGLYLRFARAV